jgi:hypothetical protein
MKEASVESNKVKYSDLYGKTVVTLKYEYCTYYWITIIMDKIKNATYA